MADQLEIPPEPHKAAENVQWASILLDEWKYRHESLWKTVYRYIWYDLTIPRIGCALYGRAPRAGSLALRYHEFDSEQGEAV
jgi:hypothetical protein